MSPTPVGLGGVDQFPEALPSHEVETSNTTQMGWRGLNYYYLYLSLYKFLLGYEMLFSIGYQTLMKHSKPECNNLSKLFFLLIVLKLIINLKKHIELFKAVLEINELEGEYFLDFSKFGMLQVVEISKKFEQKN